MRFAKSLYVALFASSIVATSLACSTAVNDLAPVGLRADGPLQSVCTPVTINGRNLLVVAYSNGGGGHLAVLTDEASPTVVARSEEVMFDIAHAIELHDFSGDGRPEFVVKFLNRNDLLSWIFAFEPTRSLRLISPSFDGDATPLANAEIVDVDGDGRTEVVTVSVVKETDEEGLTVAHPTYRLYVYRDGEIREALERQVFFYSAFLRTKTKPQTETADVHVPQPGVYRLTLLNRVVGLAPCTSGDVAINGKSVFKESDFKKTAQASVADVQLQYDNLVTVKLNSAANCSVALIVDQPTN